MYNLSKSVEKLRSYGQKNSPLHSPEKYNVVHFFGRNSCVAVLCTFTALTVVPNFLVILYSSKSDSHWKLLAGVLY